MAEDAQAQLRLWQKQLASIQSAKASGALTVDYPERGRSTYRPLSEMLVIEADLTRKIAAAQGPARVRTRRIVTTSSSGSADSCPVNDSANAMSVSAAREPSTRRYIENRPSSPNRRFQAAVRVVIT